LRKFNPTIPTCPRFAKWTPTRFANMASSELRLWEHLGVTVLYQALRDSVTP